MSPRPASEEVRAALIEEAARLLQDGGAAALSARRLADLVGTSTMAVYTYFGSMEELRRGVRLEAFTRLAESLERVPTTADPVADAAAVGAAYLGTAIANPALYRAMFLDAVFDDHERAITEATFQRLAEAVHRCVGAGLFNRADPDSIALEMWASTHGIASLYAANMWSDADALAHMAAFGRTVLLGLGVSERHADVALEHAAAFARPARPRHSGRAVRAR